jgi:hypothetical protein
MNFEAALGSSVSEDMDRPIAVPGTTVEPSEKQAGSTGQKRADFEGQGCLQLWSREGRSKAINPAAAAAAGN